MSDINTAIKEVSALPTCQLCSEMATVVTENGTYLCGIPGNHPDYDKDKNVPISLVTAE